MEETKNINGQPGGEPEMKELKNVSLIFGRALGLILKEGQGIVVDIVGEIELGNDIKKVIVFKNNDRVHIYKCDEDLPEGTPLSLDNEINE